MKGTDVSVLCASKVYLIAFSVFSFLFVFARVCRVKEASGGSFSSRRNLYFDVLLRAASHSIVGREGDSPTFSMAMGLSTPFTITSGAKIFISPQSFSLNEKLYYTLLAFL